MMAKQFKAVIFDMGGVLLRTENNTPRQALAERFGTTREELEEFVFAGPTSLQSEVGVLSDADHWRAVLKRYGQDHLDVKDVYREFFNGDGLNQELLNYAYALKPVYRIALLSNAWTNTRENLKDTFDFIDCFEISIFSAEVGVRKPDPAIFEIMLERLGVKASEAIFIDDMEINASAARSLGMEAIHFTSTEETIGQLNRLLKSAS
jgi:epoxide hydrolase-like predicted phosphatase